MSEMEIAGWVLLVLAVLICGLMIYSFAASLLADDDEDAEWNELKDWGESEPVATLPDSGLIWCNECYRERVPFDPFQERSICVRCKKDLEAVA